MNITSIIKSLKTIVAFPVLGTSFENKDFISLDLSVDNKVLQNINISNSKDLESYIWSYLNANNAKVAYGGYLEQRGIYNRSEHFNRQDSEKDRNIHLGTDLWIEANTKIYAPLDGEIHSFKNNKNFGDYGPTLILKHTPKDFVFYTLYGHLSEASLVNKSIGQPIDKGQEIARLGTADVNGDYPPHLHFQIILDMQGFKGDYPGVSNALDLEFYKTNCPDPKLLLDL